MELMVRYWILKKLAKQIVDAHEGSISVDNVIEENVIKGAKFIVNLPQVNINK